MKRKYTIQLHVLITAVLIMAPTMAHGQSSYIKDLQFTDKHSLIRTVDESEYLLYSYDRGDNSFYLFPDGGTSAPFFMTIDKNIEVNDMEISDDTVYFCGQRYEEDGVTRAVLGHFPLSGFPYINLSFIVDSTMTTFKKMDVYHVEQQGGRQVHVVMTAVDIDGYGTMMDACRMGGIMWYAYSFDGKTVDETFDDVVVVKSWEHPYVVFSSRNMGKITSNKYNRSRVWVFNQPGYINLPIFPYHVACYDIGFGEPLPSGPVQLEILNGWFVSAAIVGSDTLQVNRYTYNGYDRSVLIKGLSRMTLKDIQYNHMNAFCHDVLVTTTTPTTVDSYIYPVQEFFFDTNVPMNARLYKDEDLNSLALVSYDDNIYVASGHAAATQPLRVYKYQFNEWVCSMEYMIFPNKHKYESKVVEADIPFINNIQYMKVNEIDPETKGIRTICTTNQ